MRTAVAILGLLLASIATPAQAQAGCGNPVSPLLAFGEAGPDLLQVGRDLQALGVETRVRYVDTNGGGLDDWFSRTAQDCGWVENRQVDDSLLVVAVDTDGQAQVWRGSDVLLVDEEMIDRLIGGIIRVAADAGDSGSIGEAVFAVMTRFRDVQRQPVIDTAQTCGAVVLPQQVFGTALPAIVDQTVRLRRLGVNLRLRVLEDSQAVDPAAWLSQTAQAACPQWLDDHSPVPQLAVALMSADAGTGRGGLELFSGQHTPTIPMIPASTPQVVRALTGEDRFPEAALLLLQELVDVARDTLTRDIIASPGTDQQSCATTAIDPWNILAPDRRATLEGLASQLQATGVSPMIRLLPGTPEGMTDWLNQQEAACEDWSDQDGRRPDLLVVAVSEGTGEAGLAYGSALRERLDPVASDVRADMQRLIDGNEHADALETAMQRLSEAILPDGQEPAPPSDDPAAVPLDVAPATTDAVDFPAAGSTSPQPLFIVLLMLGIGSVIGLLANRRRTRRHAQDGTSLAWTHPSRPAARIPDDPDLTRSTASYTDTETAADNDAAAHSDTAAYGTEGDLAQRVNRLMTARLAALPALEEALTDLPGALAAWDRLSARYGPETLAVGAPPDPRVPSAKLAEDLDSHLNRISTAPLPSPDPSQVADVEASVLNAMNAARQVTSLVAQVAAIQAEVDTIARKLPGDRANIEAALVRLDWFVRADSPAAVEGHLALLASARELLDQADEPDEEPHLTDPVRTRRLVGEAGEVIAQVDAAARASRDRLDRSRSHPTSGDDWKFFP